MIGYFKVSLLATEAGVIILLPANLKDKEITGRSSSPNALLNFFFQLLILPFIADFGTDAKKISVDWCLSVVPGPVLALRWSGLVRQPEG